MPGVALVEVIGWMRSNGLPAPPKSAALTHQVDEDWFGAVLNPSAPSIELRGEKMQAIPT